MAYELNIIALNKSAIYWFGDSSDGVDSCLTV